MQFKIDWKCYNAKWGPDQYVVLTNYSPFNKKYFGEFYQINTTTTNFRAIICDNYELQNRSCQIAFILPQLV